MATKKCPVCGVPVKLENLEGHVKRQHPRKNIDLKSVLTKEEMTQAKAAKASSKPKFEMKRAWPLAVLAIIIVVVLFVALQKPTANATGIGVGQTAPEITLTTSDGNPIKLSDLRGKPTLLEFMDVDCGHCDAEGYVLAQVYNDRVSVANFFTVDANSYLDADTNARIELFKQAHNTYWPYALDTDGSVSKQYGLAGTPRTYILDKVGVVRNVFEGQVSGGKATYEAAIDALV